MQDKTNEPAPVGFLLLRDGHAVPLTGLSPDEIKLARKRAVQIPEVPLRHNQGLTAVVHTLGFRGDFGDYQREGWPWFEAFLKMHGCTHQRNLFPTERWMGFRFYFGPGLGPTRRQLADRLYFAPERRPTRVFLGTGIDWAPWDELAHGIQPLRFQSSEFRRDEEFVAGSRDEAIVFVLDHRNELMSQWGFLDDKLVAGPVDGVVSKVYYPDRQPQAERELYARQSLALIRAFRAIFDAEAGGWTDVIPVTDSLTILRAADGGWDMVWRNLRDGAPPHIEGRAERYGLHVSDLPMALASENDLARRLYFRPAWDELEAHAAEQHFYDVGHTMVERQQAQDFEVRRRYLVDTGKLPQAPRAERGRAIPSGFHEVVVAGGTAWVSDLVTVGEYRRMLEETGYGERRERDAEPWDRANEGEPPDAPVGATWNDAQAFCAWKERQLGVGLRLLTTREHRGIRPFYSERYASLSGGDFFWESRPPRPIVEIGPDGAERQLPVPSGVLWSEPRFLEPTADLPEFAPSGGWATTSRKRWITDFPPRARWTETSWAEHQGLRFIDAWDAYEWCQEHGFIAGRYWEGQIGADSWGAYKNVKVGFRVVIALD